MRKKKPADPDTGNREWTEADFRRARPALEVLPREVVDAIRRYRGQRGPQKAPTKELISIRVDRDVVAAFRASGPGWQRRANDALREYLRKGERKAPRASKATRGRKTA